MSDFPVSYMMPLGQYKNWPLAHIPVDYLKKIYRYQSLMKKYPDIKQYIENKHSDLLPPPPATKLLQPLCKTEKICYVDEGAAITALKLIKQDKRKHSKPKSSYYCKFCGFWHHTKKP